MTWTSTGSVHAGHLVAGDLSGAGSTLPCDLLGVDQAYPEPVLTEEWRIRSHRSWTHGQVLLLTREGRATVAAPGTAWQPDLVLEALTRLARSVGSDPTSWTAHLALSRPSR